MGLLQVDGCTRAKTGRLLANDGAALFAEAGPIPKMFIPILSESVVCVWSARGAV